MLLTFANKFILSTWIFFYQQSTSYSKYHWKTSVNNLTTNNLKRSPPSWLGVSFASPPRTQTPTPFLINQALILCGSVHCIFRLSSLSPLYFLAFSHCTVWISRLAKSLYLQPLLWMSPSSFKWNLADPYVSSASNAKGGWLSLTFRLSLGLELHCCFQTLLHTNT